MPFQEALKGDALWAPQSGPNPEWHQSVTNLIDLVVLGHESQVSCPQTILLLWLPLQLDRGAFPSGKHKNAHHLLYTR